MKFLFLPYCTCTVVFNAELKSIILVDPIRVNRRTRRKNYASIECSCRQNTMVASCKSQSNFSDMQAREVRI